MYDRRTVLQAILAHAREAHAGVVTLAEAASQIRGLAAVSALWGDRAVATPALACAEAFEAGDFCTICVPALAQVVAVDDEAIPQWRQSEGPLIVHLEADARSLQVTEQEAMRARYPGFPRER